MFIICHLLGNENGRHPNICNTLRRKSKEDPNKPVTRRFKILRGREPRWNEPKDQKWRALQHICTISLKRINKVRRKILRGAGYFSRKQHLVFWWCCVVAVKQGQLH
jgi:hypothetical protein